MSAFRKDPPASAEPWCETGRPPGRPAAGPPMAERLGLLPNQPQVAVLIPCRNEEASIGKVVGDFLQALPDANVYVYDNNSTDRTARQAQTAGGFVRRERLQGKGHVVRRMFADIEADIYILVDGDDTYDAAAAPGMLRMLIDQHLDMVTATRHGGGRDAYRPGHRLGNRLLTFLVTRAFGTGISDLLSGYRVFSRRFVKSFPALASGFETETEFSVHALTLHMPVQEVQTLYRNRPSGSRSKLNTVADGLRILRAIATLIRQERPLEVFSIAALIFAALGFGFGIPIVLEFLHSGLVTRLPTALLATGFVLLAFLSVTCGLILDAVSRGRREIRRLAYLAISPAEWLE
jgi:glycosyltransferase involved in cell wall biosynthesis